MIDVVIPARNEAKTIAGICDTLRSHPNVGRVIVVVDDATTDATINTAYGHATHTTLGPKGGNNKGANVLWGLKLVTTDRVLFCDADLEGLTLEHITLLTINHGGGQVIGVPDWPERAIMDNGIVKDVPQVWTKRLLRSWPWVSGERCMPTDVALAIPLHGYLMEVQINNTMRKLGLPTQFVRLTGLTAPFRLTTERLNEMQRDLEYGRRVGVL